MKNNVLTSDLRAEIAFLDEKIQRLEMKMEGQQSQLFKLNYPPKFDYLDNVTIKDVEYQIIQIEQETEYYEDDGFEKWRKTWQYTMINVKTKEHEAHFESELTNIV